MLPLREVRLKFVDVLFSQLERSRRTFFRALLFIRFSQLEKSPPFGDGRR